MTTCADIVDWEYDVFISFKPDDDSGRNFTHHLLKAMDKKGILFYNHNKQAHADEERTRVLAIRLSRFAVIVFSVNYASSLTCLDELIQVQTTSGQTVLPVFLDADPSAVRKQSCSFANAFQEYEVLFRDELDKVDKWRAAFKDVAGRSGWHLRNKSENQCIQEIVEFILSKLNLGFSNPSDELVGIDSRVEELKSHLELKQTGEVRTVAICGVPGIGKTTIAKYLRDRIFFEFQGNCFLSDVSQVSRRNGLQKLQAQIISEIFEEENPKTELKDTVEVTSELRNKLQRTQVLLILDGIDELKHLEMLAGSQDWFGPGSRIIITATDEDLFTNYEDIYIYEPGKLNDDEAFRLLSIKAFHKADPPEEYIGLLKQIVTSAEGIPAVINEIGSFLYGRGKNEWESTVKRLKENPM